MKKSNPHVGSTLEEFLAEQGLLVAAEAVAVKRVLSYQLQAAMTESGVSKSEMARRMKTSRAAIERLLDPDSGAVTLATVSRAAAALGKRLAIALADPPAHAPRAREPHAVYSVASGRRREPGARQLKR